MRWLTRLLTAIFAIIVSLALWIVVSFVVNDFLMSREVTAIREWIVKEIPMGSTVPHTFDVLRRHGVKPENMSYYEKDFRLIAVYPKPSSLLRPIEGAIYLDFHYATSGNLEAYEVYKSYSFL